MIRILTRRGLLRLSIILGVSALSMIALLHTVSAADTGSPANALYVCPSDCQFNAIQPAINAAAPGDLILVAQGTYVGAIVVTKTVILQGGYSSNWQRNISLYRTVIDGNGSGPVVWVTSGFSPTIDGFTITGGNNTGWGGGVAINSSSPLISHNTITNNRASNYGGGVYVVGSAAAPILDSNFIISNTSGGNGGGVFIDDFSKPVLVNNVIARNRANSNGGGIYVDYYAGPSIINNTIAENNLGSLWANEGIVLYNTPSPITIVNNIVITHTYGIRNLSGTALSITLDYNDLWACTSGCYAGVAPGPHDQSIHPRFVDARNYDYHLACDSPIIDMGTGVGAPAKDFDDQPRPIGDGVDIGADEYSGPRPCPTSTPTPTATRTPTPTQTQSPSPTRTRTPTATYTYSPTPTPLVAPTSQATPQAHIYLPLILQCYPPFSNPSMTFPAITIDQSKRVHIVWIRPHALDTSIDYVQISSAQSCFSPITVATVPGHVSSIAIAVDSTSTVHVVWSITSPSGLGIHHMYRTSTGVWSAPQLISQDTSAQLFSRLVLARGCAGDIHLVWANTRANSVPSSRYWMTHARIASNGALLQSPETIGYSVAVHPVYPAIAVDTSCTLHMVFNDWAGTDWAIFYRNKLNGGAWISAENVSGLAHDAHAPAIAVGPADILHVVWDQLNNATRDVFYMNKTASHAWSAPINLTDNPGGTVAFNPNVAADGSATAYVVWSRSGYSIEYRYRPINGGWSEKGSIGYGFDWSTAADVTSGIHIAWIDWLIENVRYAHCTQASCEMMH